MSETTPDRPESPPTDDGSAASPTGATRWEPAPPPASQRPTEGTSAPAGQAGDQSGASAGSQGQGSRPWEAQSSSGGHWQASATHPPQSGMPHTQPPALGGHQAPGGGPQAGASRDAAGAQPGAGARQSGAGAGQPGAGANQPGPGGGQPGAGASQSSAPSGAGVPMPPPTSSGRSRGGPEAAAPEARDALLRVRAEVGKAVVGQDAAVAGLLVALLAKGHILLEGVPGVAKTLLVRSLAAALAVETKRVQFTPDLMPGDLTGSLVWDARASDFTFRQGPVFTNLLLADEINRTPPKTQSALLEAMEERQVSIDGEPHKLPAPFMVAATQNPVEYEGTYPLPEAQLDRFLLKVVLPIPPRDDEVQVLRRHATGFDPRDLGSAGISPVATPEDLEAGARAIRQVQISDEVTAYIVDIARATRVSPSLSLGVSPRGATALMMTARAWAWINGRGYVTPDDVKALAHATLAHRLSLRPEAELEGVSVGSVLDSALGSVPVPR